MTDTYRFQDPGVDGRIYNAIYDEAEDSGSLGDVMRVIAAIGAVSFALSSLVGGLWVETLAGGAIAALLMVAGLIFALQAWGVRRQESRNWDMDYGRSDRPRW
jgi:hypothetical protein